MVYYNKDELVIRSLEEAYAQVFSDEEKAQGWDADISKYLTRVRDQTARFQFAELIIFGG